MPRGKPRKGQFDVEIVFPDGSRIRWTSTRDHHDIAEWRDVTLRTIGEATAAVQRFGSAT